MERRCEKCCLATLTTVEDSVDIHIKVYQMAERRCLTVWDKFFGKKEHVHASSSCVKLNEFQQRPQGYPITH